MYLSTLNDIKDRKYEVIGVVHYYGEASEYVLQDLMSGLEEKAEDLNADGIIGITFTSTGIWHDSSTYDEYETYIDGGKYPDMIAFGTAIKFKD